MVIPFWLTLGVGLLALAWGAYRIRIAFRSDDEEQRARSGKGLFALARRTHFLIGLIYLLLGGALLATSFGWNPFGSLFAPRPEAPARRLPRATTLPLPAPPPSKPAEPSTPTAAPSTPSAPATAPSGGSNGPTTSAP